MDQAVQQRLSELGFDTVEAFQSANGLTPDGIVGPRTRAALMPPPDLSEQPIAQRCLALAGAFETSRSVPDCYSGIAGDFDGMGMSYGVLQWNFGKGTLQGLFSDMLASHEDVMAGIFGSSLDPLRAMLTGPVNNQLTWARSIQNPENHAISSPWSGFFQALGRTPEFQATQLTHAERYRKNGAALFERFGLTTERGFALMFDISVQNWSIDDDTEALIRADFNSIPAGSSDAEVLRMRSIANRRAEAAKPEYVEDVRRRKLTIANGEGTVHGVKYNLAAQFAIRLAPLA